MKHNPLPEISIPVPCHENWNTMSDTERGKFCSKCKKEVLDFTKVSKSDFQKIVSERKEGTCGRVLKSQLKVPEIGKKNFSSQRFTFLKKIAATFFSIVGIKILTVTSVNAQTIELRNPCESDLKKIGITPLLNNSDSTISIKGIIKDRETKEGISFLTIIISENGKQITGAIGDMDGNFELKILKRNLNKQFDIKISYIGYEDLEIKNIPVSNMSFELLMNMSQTLMGDLVYIIERINPEKNPNEKSFNQNDIKHMPH